MSRGEGRGAPARNFGFNICLDCERHNGPFIRLFFLFFQPLARNAFFPEQSFAEVLWVVAQVKGPDRWTCFFSFSFLNFFFSHTGCFQKRCLHSGSRRVRRLRTQDVDQRATFQVVAAGVGRGGSGRVRLRSAITARLAACARVSLPALQLRQQSPLWAYCSFSRHSLNWRRVKFLSPPPPPPDH